MTCRPRRMLERTAVALVAILLGAGSGLEADTQAGAEGVALEASTFAEGRARVVLKPVVQVEGRAVTLADVARFEAPPEFAERLKEVPVGPAPLPGRSRWVETAYLAVRLRQAGIDPKTVRLEGPERIELVSLAAGTPEGAGPTMAASMADPDVTRGQTVVLEAVAGPVVVQVSARALRDGRAGDRIPVLNLGSGREVEAVVVGPGRVRAEVAL